MNTFAVFKSRSEALRFLEVLRGLKISCSAINTPSYLGYGCGLSIVFPDYLRSYVTQRISEGKYRTFAGIYVK